MTVSAVDSAIFGGLFTTAAMRAVFVDHTRLQRMLDVEAALARAQARLGLIPVAAAEEIAAKARLERFDLEAIRRGTELAGYPIVPLVKALGEACDGDAGRYVHWGATTQDIVDSALVLQIRDALALIQDDLDAILRRLAALAKQFRDTPMAGRSHLQHALPISFGFKCAVWLSPLQRHRRRLDALRGEVLTVQFGGAVGTLASLGANGIAVLEALAEELDLAAPPIAWHVARDALAETVCFLGLLTGSLGKIATDVMLLMQTEVGEVAEPHAPGRGGSSTMPQKRNPIACEFILAAAKNVRQQVAVMLDAMLQDHERATGPWHAEWLALPQAFALCAGALHHSRALLEGLTVDATRMRRNLDMTRGMITAEAVMMALAPALGREAAHHVVAAACNEALASDRHLLEVLGADPQVTAHLSRTQLASLLEPDNYTGLAGAFVDRVVAGNRS
ncbi:MAG TPA: 3-carboxy-cis,cis-muconate cycloisomerase [Geminicoccaceae bacterium]|nr:3-carboxy-cis,cis-muconate cycloisomerase [Geminicoccaceae bacterium]